MIIKDSLRAFHIQINEEHFIASASRHRSDEEDPKDYYSVSYLPAENSSRQQHVLPILTEETETDVYGVAGFKINLTKRGRLSNKHLGKLIIAHIFMDLTTGRTVFDLQQYDRLLKLDQVYMDISVLIAGDEQELTDGCV